MKKNKKWFSILLAMGLVLIIWVLSISILEYIIPYWRDVKWVENSSKAFYQANSAIEEVIFRVYERNAWDSSNFREEFSETDFAWSVNRKYSTNSSWTTLPLVGYNRISAWDPIQLSIWDNFLASNSLDIEIRVPDLNNDWNQDETLSWWTLWIVNWQLSWQNNTLNSSWSLINADKINHASNKITNFNASLAWVDLYWNPSNFSTFYTNNCNSTWSWCSLKLSVVNKLETTAWVIIPYLEWRITTWGTDIIPLRYTKVEASGKSYWYKRDLEIKIPSNTVNQALDFTIFQ